MNSSFHHIDVEGAREKLDANEAVFVDIRDGESHRDGHIAPSVHLTDATVEAFLSAADQAQPVIVYCYHGNSSQMAAQFLVERGFSQVYSMDGGYEAWAHRYPTGE
jgi:thiosulfate sulfurtransferase